MAGKAGNRAVGFAKGGLTRKSMLLLMDWDACCLLLSLDNDNDSIHAVELMSMIDIVVSNLLGNKAYGTKKSCTYQGT